MTLVTFIVFIVILSILIVVHEFGHFIAAKKAKVKVEVFSLGFGKTLLRRKSGDTEYKICALPFGGYVKMAGDNTEEAKGAPDEYLSASMAKRFRIIFFGPLFNYLLGIIFFWIVFIAGTSKPLPTVGYIEEGSAKDAGITTGDTIKAIEGVNIQYWEDLQREVFRNRDKEKVAVLVDRAGQSLRFEVNLQQKTLTDDAGRKRTAGRLGIRSAPGAAVIVKTNVFEAFVLSVKSTYRVTVLTYQALWSMVTGRLSIRDSVTGPVGMFVITKEMLKLGIGPLLSFMAVLSISLGIFNLLPLPALDGGHIVLLAIEKIRRKPLSKKAEEVFNQVGFSFLILIAAFVFINDLLKFEVVQKTQDMFQKAQDLFHKTQGLFHRFFSK